MTNHGVPFSSRCLPKALYGKFTFWKGTTALRWWLDSSEEPSTLDDPASCGEVCIKDHGRGAGWNQEQLGSTSFSDRGWDGW